MESDILVANCQSVWATAISRAGAAAPQLRREVNSGI